MDRPSPDLKTELPREAWCHIFGFLPPSSLLFLSMVSQSWKTMSEDQHLWEKFLVNPKRPLRPVDRVAHQVLQRLRPTPTTSTTNQSKASYRERCIRAMCAHRAFKKPGAQLTHDLIKSLPLPDAINSEFGMIADCDAAGDLLVVSVGTTSTDYRLFDMMGSSFEPVHTINLDVGRKVTVLDGAFGLVAIPGTDKLCLITYHRTTDAPVLRGIDVETRDVLFQSNIVTGPTGCKQFEISSNGRWLAILSGGVVKAFDLHDLVSSNSPVNERNEVQIATNVHCFGFSSDSDSLYYVTESDRQVIKVWRCPTEGQGQHMPDIAFMSEERVNSPYASIGICGWSGCVALWNSTQGIQLIRVQSETPVFAKCISLSAVRPLHAEFDMEGRLFAHCENSIVMADTRSLSLWSSESKGLADAENNSIELISYTPIKLRSRWLLAQQDEMLVLHIPDLLHTYE